MAFESLLATDSLLGMIVTLMTILNISIRKLNILVEKVDKGIRRLTRYFRRDIIVRSKIERKIDKLLEIGGVDIATLNKDIDADLFKEFSQND